MGVSKNRGKTPKMDGLFHGKPYFQMDDLGGGPIFLETPAYKYLKKFTFSYFSFQLRKGPAFPPPVPDVVARGCVPELVRSPPRS